MNQMALISIVVPVYYNAPSLPSLYERLSNLAASFPEHHFEFIFVDDGSGDDSYRVLAELAQKDQRILVIKLVRNFGSNTAILAGVSYAKGNCVGFIAADLQDPPETMGEMIRQWEGGYKVVLAVRKDRLGDPFSTRIFASIFNSLFQKLVHKDFSPQGVGFFLIDRQVAEVILECSERNAHLIGLILWTGYEFTQVLYQRTDRVQGKSRWTFGKKMKYFIDAFASFSYLPLRLSSVLGFLLAFLGGVYALVVVIVRLLNKVPVEGWTTLIVVILIVSGVQLIMLGVIGEYLWRNFDATRKRPLFLVDKVIHKNQNLE